MWYISSFINGIKKRKVITILIVIQIIASFVLLLGSISLLGNIVFISNSNNWIINIEELYQVNVESTNNYNYEIVYDELKKLDNVETVATYDLLFNETEKESENFLTVDKEMYSLINDIGKNGKKFNKDDFNKTNNKNVFIGNSYEDKYKINKREVFLNENTYTVMDNLVKDKIFVTGREYMYLDMNKVIVVPVEKNDYIFNNMLVKFKENAYVPQSIKLTKDISVSFFNIKDIIMDDVKSSINGNKYSVFMGGIGSVFCIVGIIIASIFSILIRKREIGIRYAIGESRFSIYLGITIENIFISLIGGICAIIYYATWYKEHIIASNKSFYFSTITIKLDFKLLFTMFILLAIVVIISSLTTFFITRKLEPKDLIGGLH